MKEKKVGLYITCAVFDLLKIKNLADNTTTETTNTPGVARPQFYRNSSGR